jgi:hypothetical protein
MAKVNPIARTRSRLKRIPASSAKRMHLPKTAYSSSRSQFFARPLPRNAVEQILNNVGSKFVPQDINIEELAGALGESAYMHSIWSQLASGKRKSQQRRSLRKVIRKAEFLRDYPIENVAFCQGIANGAVEWRSASKDTEDYSTSKRFNTELRLIGCIDIDFYECTLCIRRSAAIAKTWSP